MLRVIVSARWREALKLSYHALSHRHGILTAHGYQKPLRSILVNVPRAALTLHGWFVKITLNNGSNCLYFRSA
jgi:hypothetical protein